MAEELKIFSEVKWIVADLDGTLISPDMKELAEIITEFQHKLKYHKYKVGFTLATGRTYYGVLPYLKQINLSSNTPLILYNGSLVITHLNHIVISKNCISKKAFKEILAISDYFDIKVYAYLFYDKLFMDHSIDEMENVYGWSKKDKPDKDFNGKVIIWKNEKFLPNNLLALLIDVSNEKNVDKLKQMLMNIKSITITSSGNKFIEIRPVNSNKGIALLSLASFLKITPSNILAIGDNDNDAEMLKTAGIGVAVSSASKKAISSSNFITKYSLYQGVIEVLYLIKASKRFYPK